MNLVNVPRGSSYAGAQTRYIVTLVTSYFWFSLNALKHQTSMPNAVVAGTALENLSVILSWLFSGLVTAIL